MTHSLFKEVKLSNISQKENPSEFEKSPKTEFKRAYQNLVFSSLVPQLSGQVDTVSASLYTVSWFSFQPRGRGPPKGHQINPRGCEMIDGRGEEQSSVLVHKSVFGSWTLCFYREILRI